MGYAPGRGSRPRNATYARLVVQQQLTSPAYPHALRQDSPNSLHALSRASRALRRSSLVADSSRYGPMSTIGRRSVLIVPTAERSGLLSMVMLLGVLCVVVVYDSSVSPRWGAGLCTTLVSLSAARGAYSHLAGACRRVTGSERYAGANGPEQLTAAVLLWSQSAFPLLPTSLPDHVLTAADHCRTAAAYRCTMELHDIDMAPDSPPR